MLRQMLATMAVVYGLGALPAEATTAKAKPVITAPVADKQRLIVLTDIEADADDSESLVRLLLYANEIDIEGLIATTSVHQKARVAPESIRRIVGVYAGVQPNLLLHERGYPTGAALLARVTQGQPAYGMAGVGDGKDTSGSNLILQALESPDPRPLWVTAWGGANTLAQALFTLRKTHTPQDTARLVAKLRVYTISDQDDSGIWLRTQFPDLFYIVSPGGYGAATWEGMTDVEDGFDNSEISNAWIADHIQQGHGPLGALYPDVAYGVEGDTPSFLSLIPNGLNAPEHPDWGGWGGRYRLYVPDIATTDPAGFNGGVPVTQEPRPIWTNAVDSYQPYIASDFGRAGRFSDKTATGFRIAVWRWRKEVQNDFAARIDWTIKPYRQANHPPVVVLGHPDYLTVKSGQMFTLSAAGTTDPDGDSLSYLWFNYAEAGTMTAPVPIANAEDLYEVRVTAPEVTRPETLHYILRVTDKGSPPLTRYRRVIVTVEP